MPGADISITVSQNVTTAFQAAIDASVDLTPVMADIAGHLDDVTRDRFETNVSPIGVPWIPSERAKAESGKTLVWHGDLLASIKPNWGRDFAEAGPEASGGAAVYAKIHQFGGIIRAKAGKALSFAGRLVAAVRIPARPYLGWTDDDADYAVEAIGEHLAKAFAQPGVSA